MNVFSSHLLPKQETGPAGSVSLLAPSYSSDQLASSLSSPPITRFLAKKTTLKVGNSYLPGDSTRHIPLYLIRWGISPGLSLPGSDYSTTCQCPIFASEEESWIPNELRPLCGFPKKVELPEHFVMLLHIRPIMPG